MKLFSYIKNSLNIFRKNKLLKKEIKSLKLTIDKLQDEIYIEKCYNEYIDIYYQTKKNEKLAKRREEIRKKGVELKKIKKH